MSAIVVVVVVKVSSLYRLSNSLEVAMVMRAITTLMTAKCHYTYSTGVNVKIPGTGQLHQVRMIYTPLHPTFI